MKERILKGWNFQRVIYILIGAFIIAHAVAEAQWILLVAGGYISAMGIFAFGCAAGNCVGRE